MSTAIAQPSPASIPVLIASSDAELRREASKRFSSREWSVSEALGGADALCKLEDRYCKVLLLDQHLPDLHPDDLVGIVESRFPGTDVVLFDRERRAPRIPLELLDDEVYKALQDCWQFSPQLPSPQTPAAERLPGMIGDSTAMRDLFESVRLVANRDTTVLITGETGSGKELVARALHGLSRRRDGQLVAVNCGAIPEALLEAELFGHTRGAFTGAVQARIGKIQAAQGGTLFLDEIGDLDAGLQVKLLRFLEDGEVQRLGSSEVFHVDVRVVAATNADLEERVADGRFRADLYYRLSVFPIEVPSLRQRESDIMLLAQTFLARFGGSSIRFSAEAEAKLQQHDWPGNVRELLHVVERAAILCGRSDEVQAKHIQLKRPPASAKGVSR